MNGFKLFLGISFFFAVMLLASFLDHMVLLPIAGAFLLLYLFASMFRYKKWIQPFFQSPLSFYHGKYSKRVHFDLPPHILYEKLLEFYGSKEGYKTHDYRDELIVVVGTPFSWISWSENIILKLEPKNGGESTELTFTSLAFSTFAWGKNEQNFKVLNQNIQEAFVV